MMPIVIRVLVVVAVCLQGPGALAGGDGDAVSLRCWRPDRRTAQLAWERTLDACADAASLRAHHDRLAGAPHVAGSPGDLRVAAGIARYFRELGLEVEEQEIHVYLARPVAAALEVVEPTRCVLPLREEDVDGLSGNAELSFGWNAYSASGDVTAEVVYANYATREDFGRLRELGVDCTGRIVVARYGGNYRGYKAKFAEAAGAAGLVIYTDPADSGFFKGVMYPEGGYANPTAIQRGSILTLDYHGDPLTPLRPATSDAERVDPATLPLPRIPVQPVGWKAAREILGRMRGAEVPDAWQGALPFRYRLTGPGLRVRLMVKQEREVVRTVNVVGTLRGSACPDQLVIAGAHHDAWGYGAGDPTAGTILVLEAARCFAKAGVRPLRSICFAAWAAEEFGIIGSVEWIEAHDDTLAEHAVAYVNLDMAAMGPIVHSSAAPSLKRVLHDACEAATGKPLERFGDLGGGSDHVGFLCHMAIPSASLGGGGGRGTSYHTNYDNLAWYRKVVGEDYAPALKLTRVLGRTLARLANGDVVPLDPVQSAVDAKLHLLDLARRAPAWDFAPVVEAAARYERRARAVHAALLDRVAELPAARLDRVNALLVTLERAWLHAPGLPGRPWFRSLFAASDEDSGYAAWMLPGLRSAVEREDAGAFARARERYVAIFADLEARLAEIAAAAR